jgi:hypothetical protein
MFSPDSHLIIANLFPRLMGIIYFFSLGSFLFQIRGLIGERGILPVKAYLNPFQQRWGKRRFYWIPTVFWLNSSDQALMFITGLGTFLAILLTLGVYPFLMLPLLFLIHLSIISVGQDFLSFGWEMFFLETSCHAFLLSLTSVPNLVVWISVYLLIFRFHIQAGTSKLLSREPVWRNLTALAYHYQTQPLPNTIAWYLHKFPLWFHKLSTLMTLLIEIVLPFAIFGPKELQLTAFLGFFFLQFVVWLSGNYSYLNHLTVVLVSLLINDSYLQFFFSLPDTSLTSEYLDFFLYTAGSIMIFLQLLRLYHHFSHNKKVGRILSYIEPFHIANRYGIFAVMTTTRYEIVIEGSHDKKEWKEYIFFYKPSEITHRPRRVSPYQPRIDWQAWFLPFEEFNSRIWFQNLLYRLLEGSPQVLSLLKFNPFPDKPPLFIRAIVYIYEFSDRKTKQSKGEWWRRTYVGPYSPVLYRKKVN